MALTSLEANILVLSDRNATVASVALIDPDSDYGTERRAIATGSSKREPGDVYDVDIATDLAVGRALVKLGRELQGNAQKRVEAAAKANPAKEVDPEVDTWLLTYTSPLKEQPLFSWLRSVRGR